MVLFDEIEKAHPEVFNILLQIFDNGRLTDAKGRHVNFKNTIIIMTSNVGSEFISEMEKLGFETEKHGDGDRAKELKEKIRNALEKRFRPEFINRIDEIIIFNPLTPKELGKIVAIQLENVKERLGAKDISVTLSDEALEFLAKRGYDPLYGARPLKRLIQTALLDPLAERIISGDIVGGGKVAVDAENDALVIKSSIKSPFGKITRKKEATV